MDRTLPDPQMIADHLAQAERHVADAQEQVQRQREVIAKLKRDGHDARLANKLLDNFVALAAAHIADRDRLRGELAKTR